MRKEFMNKKYLLKSTFKVALLSRLFAKAIDFFIVIVLSFFFYPFGVVLGTLYIALCDGLQEGQSVGKRVVGFRVVSMEDGKPCTFNQSLIRNLPFGVPLLFTIVPVWGWIFSAFIGLPLILLELYLLLKIASGNRLGDVMADTTVMSPLNQGEPVKSKTPGGWFGTEKAIPTKRKKWDPLPVNQPARK